MRYLVSLTLLSVTVAFLGCSQQQVANTSDQEPVAASVVAVNEHCPMMGDDVTDEGGTVEWNGQTVGFCCTDCVGEFEALSDEEKTTALASAGESHGSHDHGDHDHGDHDAGDEGDHDHGDHDGATEES